MKNILKNLIYCISYLFLIIISNKVDAKLLEDHLRISDQEYAYATYLPDNYDPSQEWPIILYLHGAGEKGDDVTQVSQSGIYPAVLENPENYPAIILMPQVKKKMTWMNEESQQLAIQVLETAFERYSVNKRKVYLTGFSMGGLGSWELGIRFHSLFAAVVPVASTRIRSENALPLLKKTPVMIFHGTGDLYSPITLARMALKQLRAVGNGNANLVEYSKASHGGSAALAYRDPRLFKWLFEQEKP